MCWSIYSLDWQSYQTFMILKWVIYIGYIYIYIYRERVFYGIAVLLKNVMSVVGINSDLDGIIAIGMKFVFGY